ncbi:MAG: efflux RND transporter periplasmic adaptor subunit [Rhabdochlamydiaceae bacterium]
MKGSLYKKSCLPYLAFIGFAIALYLMFYKEGSKSLSFVESPPYSAYPTQICGVGVIEPEGETVKVATDLIGVARQVLVEGGDKVKEGDLLCVLDTVSIDAQIAVLKRKLALAKIEEEEALKQFQIFDDIKDKRALSTYDHNVKKYAYEKAKHYALQTEEELKQACTERERLFIKAPFDGQILAINIHKGELTSNLPEGALLYMGDTDRLYVRVEIDEGQSIPLGKDNAAYGFIRGDTTQKISLDFVRVEPLVRSKQNLSIIGQKVDTRVLQVIYEIKDSEDKWRVGQQMDVFINASKKSSS